MIEIKKKECDRCGDYDFLRTVSHSDNRLICRKCEKMFQELIIKPNRRLIYKKTSCQGSAMVNALRDLYDICMDNKFALYLRGARLSEEINSMDKKSNKIKIPIDKYTFDDCCLMNDPCDRHKNDRN